MCRGRGMQAATSCLDQSSSNSGHHLGVQRCQSPDRADQLVAVEVEHAEDDLTAVLGDCIAGQQHAVGRKVDRDAAGGVPWDREHRRAAAEIEYVAVLHLLVDDHRRGTEVAADLLEQRPLPVQQHRGGNRHVTADQRSLQAVGDHRGITAAADLGGRPGVVAMGVGEHDPDQLPGLPADRADGRRHVIARAHRTGVDQGETVAILPEIGLTDVEAQHVQPGM